MMICEGALEELVIYRLLFVSAESAAGISPEESLFVDVCVSMVGPRPGYLVLEA